MRDGCSLFYIAGFQSLQWSISCLFTGDAETIPGVSANEDVSTGVETDGPLRWRQIVVTKSLVPLTGGTQHDIPEAVHSRGQSREFLEQAFDEGNICAQMRNLLVLFHVDSKFLPQFCPLDHIVNDPAATVIRASGHQMFSFCRSVCREEKAQLLSPLTNSYYFAPRLGSIYSCLVNNIRFFVCKTE